MKKIISRNELFKIVCVSTYDENAGSIVYYELVEEPNMLVQVFDTFAAAEEIMQQKTEFWKSLLKRIPQYCQVRFIA